MGNLINMWANTVQTSSCVANSETMTFIIDTIPCILIAIYDFIKLHINYALSFDLVKFLHAMTISAGECCNLVQV